MNNLISREKISSIGFDVVDPSQLSGAKKELFLRRKQAVELKLDGFTGAEIRKITAIHESDLTRLFKRYTTISEKGIYLGEAGLIPNYRIASYTRVKKPEPKHSEGQGGLAGVLGYTLNKHSGIAEKFEAEVLRRNAKLCHGAKFSKRGLYRFFYDTCRSEGVADDEWPLNQLRGARKTVGAYINRILDLDFGRAALVSGGRIASTHSKVGTGHIPLLEDFNVYDFIEIDSWHMDAFFVLNISGDRSIKSKDVISRIWMIAAVCRRSNAVLAIKFVFSSEIRSQDLVDLICEAYIGSWRPREHLNVRGVQYSESSGMPGFSFPSLRNHVWGCICLDNAMQHHANKVYELALHTLGFSINHGPLEEPARRPKVEGLFKRIATNVIHQIPSTTGSNPQTGRAEFPEQAAVHYQIDVDDALEVMDVITANYNGTPQGGANKANSPLDVLRQYCSDSGDLIPKSHEAYLNSIAVGSLTRRARVTGSITKGIRPRVKLDQAIYTSPELAKSSYLIGKSLLIRINPHDYRHVEAYLPDGIYFGVLTVEAAWRNTAHSVTTRKLINRAFAKKEFEIMQGESPILAWQRHLKANASPRNNREMRRLKSETDKDTADIQPAVAVIGVEQSTSERWKKLDIIQ